MKCKQCNTEVTGFERTCPCCGTYLVTELGNQQHAVSYYENQIVSKQAEATSEEEGLAGGEIEEDQENYGLQIHKKGSKGVQWVGIWLVSVLVVSLLGVRWYRNRLVEFDVDTCFYIKKDSLHMIRPEDNKTIAMGQGSVEWMGYGLQEERMYTSDRKKLVYPIINQSSSTSAGDLFYMENRKNAKPVLIAEEVVSYGVTANDTVIYTTTEGTVYQYDFEETAIIGDEVDISMVSRTGECVLYFNLDQNSLRVMDLDGGEVFFISCDSVYQFSEDFSKIVYGLKGELYYTEFVNGERKEEWVASNVRNAVMKIEVEGPIIYYTVGEEEDGVSYYSYVEDTYLEYDQRMSKPESSQNNPDYEEWIKEYEAKVKRDEIREFLKKSMLGNTLQQLYRYQNGKHKLISDRIENFYTYARNQGESLPFTYVERVSESGVPRFPFDEDSDKDLLVQLIEAAYFSEQRMYQEKMIITGLEQPLSTEMAFRYDLVRKEVYWIQRNQNGCYQVMRCSYASENTEMEVCAELYREIMIDTVVGGNIFFHYLEGDDTEYMITQQGTRTVSEECNLVSAKVVEDGTIFYLVIEDMVGNLYQMQEDGNVTIVAKDVAGYQPISKEEVYVIQDYDSDSGLGTLMYYRGDEMPRRIDTEVKQIGNQKSLLNGW